MMNLVGQGKGQIHAAAQRLSCDFPLFHPASRFSFFTLLFPR